MISTLASAYARILLEYTLVERPVLRLCILAGYTLVGPYANVIVEFSLVALARVTHLIERSARAVILNRSIEASCAARKAYFERVGAKWEIQAVGGLRGASGLHRRGLRTGGSPDAGDGGRLSVDGLPGG